MAWFPFNVERYSTLKAHKVRRQAKSAETALLFRIVSRLSKGEIKRTVYGSILTVD